MKKTYLFLLFLSFLLTITIWGNAQQVVANAGTEWKDENICLSWTLGEPITQSFENELLVTQGFHQPDLLVSSIYRLMTSDVNIEVYPNPVISVLGLKITNAAQKCRVMVVNSNGDVLISEDMFLCKEPTMLDFGLFSQGTYFIRIIDQQNLVIESFKIVKL